MSLTPKLPSAVRIQEVWVHHIPSPLTGTMKCAPLSLPGRSMGTLVAVMHCLIQIFTTGESSRLATADKWTATFLILLSRWHFSQTKTNPISLANSSLQSELLHPSSGKPPIFAEKMASRGCAPVCERRREDLLDYGQPWDYQSLLTSESLQNHAKSPPPSHIRTHLFLTLGRQFYWFPHRWVRKKATKLVPCFPRPIMATIYINMSNITLHHICELSVEFTLYLTGFTLCTSWFTFTGLRMPLKLFA